MSSADQRLWLQTVCQQQGISISDSALERISAAGDTVAQAIEQSASGSLFDTEPAALATLLSELADAGDKS